MVYGVVDNKSGQLSRFDQAKLAERFANLPEDFDMTCYGFNSAELVALSKDVSETLNEPWAEHDQLTGDAEDTHAIVADGDRIVLRVLSDEGWDKLKDALSPVTDWPKSGRPKQLKVD